MPGVGLTLEGRTANMEVRAMKAGMRGIGSCVLVACVIASTSGASTPEYPPGSDVPAPGSAFVLPHAPQARMIDGSGTCELIAGIRARNGSVMQGGVHLFRWGETKPFLHVTTREDGLIVAHFPARPNERVLGGAYHRDPRNGRWVRAPRVTTRCRSGNVSAGELDVVEEDARPR